MIIISRLAWLRVTTSLNKHSCTAFLLERQMGQGEYANTALREFF